MILIYGGLPAEKLELMECFRFFRVIHQYISFTRTYLTAHELASTILNGGLQQLIELLQV